MAQRSFKKIISNAQTTDGSAPSINNAFSELNRVFSTLQNNVSEAISPTLSNPLIDGHFLNNIAVVSGSTKIEHKLSRTIKGYIIVGRTANVTVYDTLATAIDSDKFLHLVSSGTAALNLYVF